MENDPKAAGRHRRTGEEVSRLVNEFEASGLSAGAFCHRHGLSASTLRRRLLKRRGPEGRATARVRLVPVKLHGAPRRAEQEGDGAALEVRLAGGRRIGVAPRFDGATLSRLVQVLEGL
ncbi:MAG: hypothetical protein JO069_06365 [Verrucomicrobia bacterium]|nr:hypothetical protein [Verrucomicrobiota bacterium]